MKKLIALFLAVTFMVTSLTACGGEKEAESTTSIATTTAIDTTGTKDVDLTPETFTIFWPSEYANFDNFESPIAQELTKKTGVKLKFEFPAGGDASTKLNLMLASNEYPDLIANLGQNSQRWVEAKALVDLTGLIDKYGPNIKAFYGDNYNRLKNSVDKAIYGFGYGSNYNDDVAGYSWNQGFSLQNGALKEAGYPTMKTLQDFENVIKSYVEKNPKVDGKTTIGLSLVCSDKKWKFTLTSPAGFATGKAVSNSEYYIDENTNKVVFHLTTPEEKEYFRWLNHMNAEGLLDPESFTQTYDAYKAKIASGRVVGLIDALWEYIDGQNKLKAEGKFDKMYCPFPVVQDTNTQKWRAFTSGGSGGGGISMTTACKKPEKITRFFNYLASEEGQILRSWGLEGVHHDIVNGKREMKPDMKKQDIENGPAFVKSTGVKLYVGGEWLCSGNGAVDSKGQSITNQYPDQLDKLFNDADKETLKAYGVPSHMDLYPKKSELPKLKYGSAPETAISDENKVIQKKVTDSILPGIARAVLATPDKFDSEWDKFLKELSDAGLPKLEEELTKQYNDRVELWK